MPQELRHLYKAGAIAASVTLQVSPSGTSIGMSATPLRAVSEQPKRAFFKAVSPWATKSPGFNQRMMNPATQRAPLAVRVGQGESRKLNARPQLQPIPISNLLGPAVAGRRSDE
jgi:hypothetical protein